MKAFPVPSYVNVAGETHDVSNQGMDLRDYFAAKALQGILACNYEVKEEPAVLAYKYADEMISERNKNAS
jgi:hypothetical protein